MQNKPRGAKLDLNTRHLAPFVEALWARHPFLLLVEEESVMRPKSICVRHPSEEIAWGNVQTITLVAQRLKFDCHLAEYSVKVKSDCSVRIEHSSLGKLSILGDGNTQK